MAKTRDILSKVWMRRGANGVLSQRLCAGRIAQYLPTEQPKLTNRQTDMVVRNERGEIQHVEFQATNAPDLPLRMLDYWAYLRWEYKQPIRQCVFYIGTDTMRIPSEFAEGGTVHRYEVVNLQEYEAEELLKSDDWGDNLWALGARGDRPVVLREILVKVRNMIGAERESAIAELTAFSGILKLDELLQEKLKEIPMVEIDLRENAVVRPLIEEAERNARQAGRQEGMQVGQQEGKQLGEQTLLLRLLSGRFGVLPDWAEARVHEASTEELERWALRILRASSLEETLG